MSDLERKTTFDQVAREYDEIRAGYPHELIADVISISEIPADGRILEIGCGTGQATIPFAERGYSMLCLDIGAALSAIAREKARKYPAVEIETAAFEDWAPRGAQFDLIISATAFHWIKPEIGCTKAAALLKPSGALAIFRHHQARPTSGFPAAVQKVYRRVAPEWADTNAWPTTEEAIDATRQLIDRTERFDEVIIRRYPVSREFTRAEYIKLMNTASDHRMLDAARRDELLSGIGEVIDREFGGRISIDYVVILWLARKRP